jgi:dTDP-4-dehydrorhamnose reductase
VQAAFASVAPDAALNCAAWTDVEGAEAHPEQAHAINADGAGNLARAAARLGVQLVYVSTDYVFDGEACVDRFGAPRPYVESDPTGPRSVYGQMQARRRAAGAGIVRLSRALGVLPGDLLDGVR